MSIEANKAVARRYFNDVRYDPGICDEIFAPVVRFHALLHTNTNQHFDSTPKEEKKVYAWLQSVWGDLSMIIDEMIAEGDRVMVRWIFSGTQQGEYAGLPPTGRAVSYSGINIFRIENGRIAEVWDTWDRLWLWQQLGVLPDTAEFVAHAREALLERRAEGRK